MLKYQEIKFSEKTSQFCIIIPVINEGTRITKQVKKMSSFSDKIDIIIVDGGSNDNSLNIDFLKSHGIKSLLIKLSDGKLSKMKSLDMTTFDQNSYRLFLSILIKFGTDTSPNSIKTHHSRIFPNSS